MNATMQGPTPSSSHLPDWIRETHSGIVVLIGDRAYKVKKPVDLGFLDFSTPEARRRACRRELELNRRLAPDVYLDLLTVLGSDGREVDHVVVMRRMPDELRLATMVELGVDVDDHLRSLAREIAEFHAGAERGPLIAAEGGAEGLRRRWTDNLREAAQFRGSVLDPQLHEEIGRLALDYIDGRGALLSERVDAGFIVDGHGDLIADDVFCLPDQPRVLDCLEFDDRLRWVDMLDDAAFLAMDLERLGRPDLGARFLAWYCEFSAVPSPPSLRHHYIAYRAFVRAKVACIRAASGSAAAATEADQLARLTLRHLQTAEVMLVLVGGAPGTGKTTLAAELADRLGAVLLGTDTVRRELAVAEGADRYGVEAKAATYRELMRRARLALEHGESVVADATWGTGAQRSAAVDLAGETSARLEQLECHLPIEIAAVRAQQRLEQGASTSDAGAQVTRRLAAERDPWPDATTIDTHDLTEALHAALTAVAPRSTAEPRSL